MSLSITNSHREYSLQYTPQIDDKNLSPTVPATGHFFLTPQDQSLKECTKDALSNYVVSTCKSQTPTETCNDLSTSTRSSSGIKRSFQSLQESDPFPFLRKKNPFYATPQFREIFNKLVNSAGFNDVMIAVQAFNEMVFSEKDSVRNNFEDELIGKLTSLVEDLVNQETEIYDDLQRIRAAKRSLEQLDRRFGTITLKDGHLLKDTLAPFKLIIKNKISALLSTKEGATALIAEKIIAQKKGQQTRNTTVTHDQVLSLIQDRLLGVHADQLLDVSRALSRQINEIMKNPNWYAGISHHVDGNKKKFPFYSFETKETTEFALNFNCWLQFSENQKEIELFIIPNDLNILGKGALKTVFKAQKFTFSLVSEPVLRQEPENSLKQLKTTYKRHGTYTPIVLQKVKQSEYPLVDKGIALHKKIKELAPSAQIVTLPKKLNPPLFNADLDEVLYAHDWYNSDLSQAACNSLLPLDFSENPSLRQLSSLDIIKSIRDIGKALAESHKNLMIHRDVKPPNIFLKVSEDGTNLQGFAADYDLAQKAGPGPAAPASGPYEYWDTLSNQGFATPFTDVYGLALSLIETVIPDFNRSEARDMTSKKLQDSYTLKMIENILNINNKKKILTNAKKIKSIEDQLDAMVNAAVGDRKKFYQTAQNLIRAKKLVLSLFVKVVAIDHEISTSFSVDIGPLWRSIITLNNLDSTEEKNSLLIEELQLSCDVVAILGSKIPSWNSSSSSLKIENLKKHLSKNLANDSIDPKSKEELANFLAEIQMRESVIEFISQMKDLSPTERFRHPLYNSLRKPMGLGTRENIIRNINGERQIFDQTNIIENCMAYAVRLRDSFQMTVSEVMDNAMTMGAFVASLDEIIAEIELPA